MDSRAEQVKEFYHLVSRKILVNQSMFCSEFSSTLLVPFAVLGTPTEGYQKSGTVHYFGTVHHFWRIIAYHTVLIRTQPISLTQ